VDFTFIKLLRAASYACAARKALPPAGRETIFQKERW